MIENAAEMNERFAFALLQSLLASQAQAFFVQRDSLVRKDKVEMVYAGRVQGRDALLSVERAVCEQSIQIRLGLSEMSAKLICERSFQARLTVPAA